MNEGVTRFEEQIPLAQKSKVDQPWIFSLYINSRLTERIVLGVKI